MLHPENETATVSDDDPGICGFNYTVTLEGVVVTHTIVRVDFSVPRGWSVHPETATHGSDGPGTHFSSVHVLVPAGTAAGSDYHLEAYAYIDSPGPGDEDDTATAQIEVGPYCEGELIVSPCCVKAGPGDKVTVNGRVINEGNDEFTYDIDVGGTPGGISASVSPDKVTVEYESSEPFTLDIEVGANAAPGENAFNVVLSNRQYGRLCTQEMVVDTNPMQAVLRVDPDTAPPGVDITFDGSGSSTGTGPVKYRFDFGDGVSSGWQGEAVVEHAYARVGGYSASLVVEGQDGLRSTNVETVDVTITTEGFRPTATITKVEPNPACVGDEVTLAGLGAPVEGTSIRTYEWRSSLDGIIGTTALIRTSTLTAGTHDITFRVEDERSMWSGPAEAGLRVLPPRDEWRLVITRPEGGASLTGSTASVEGTCSFSDVTIDAVEVRVDEGTWMTATGRSQWTYTLDLTELSEGKHLPEVRARAGGVVSEVTSITFTTGGTASANPIMGDVGDGRLTVGVVLVGIIIAVVAVTRRRRHPQHL